ncbi:hypothetical protein [Clostridioides sp. ZZV14-6387]|uniref:hypothetical protein n=1 Tax=Clostridioides sp. ZZV14-6387 TaxID=2811497 RepID=UPI001D1145D2|nr:hypothetical protein [Clostridioides sp. ZZV14-6387]
MLLLCKFAIIEGLQYPRDIAYEGIKLKKENKANIDKVSDEILKKVKEELNKSSDKSL